MKKIFSILAVALVAFSFASCNQNKEVEQDNFVIEVSNITAKSALIAVTPADTTKTYYWDILPADTAAKMTDEQIGAYFKEYFDYLIDYYAGYYDLSYEDFILKGKDEYEYTKLDPNTEYMVVSIYMDANAVASGKATRKNFKTLEQKEDPVPADMTFQIAASDVTFSSADVAITPSNNEAYYYWNLFEAEEIAEVSDADLCAAMKENIEETIELYELFGYDLSFEDFLSKGPDAHSFTGLSSQTTYTVVAVAMGTLGTTNGAVAKYNFTTPKVEATDSLTLDLVSDYKFYDEYSVLQIVGEDSIQGLELGLAFETATPNGTFTQSDFYDDGYYYWNYIYDPETDDIYELLEANVTGAVNGDFYVYSGYGLAENGIKYIFTDVKATEYVEQEEADAPAKKLARKAPAKKVGKHFMKVNLKKKNGKFISEKLFNR